MPTAAVTHADIRQVFRDIDDETLREVLSLQPTLAELKEVAAWGRDEDSIIIRIALRNLVGQRVYSTY